MDLPGHRWGEMLEVEVSVLDGNGKLELTGSLGDVMKRIGKGCSQLLYALFLKNMALILTFYKNKDIHIHVPEGAVPKDGPSAGVTITTALVSALSGAPFKHDYAMTGEVTLRGRVLEIGGLREKTMAAYRAGVKNILIPKDNLPDLAEVDEIVKQNIRFVPCATVREVLRESLIFSKVPKEYLDSEKKEDLLLPLENGKILSGNSLNC